MDLQPWAVTASCLCFSASHELLFKVLTAIVVQFLAANRWDKKITFCLLPGTETPLDLKIYSLFPTLSLNVPFVLQKEFQAHLQSVELFLFFFQMYHAALLLCCRG